MVKKEPFLCTPVCNGVVINRNTEQSKDPRCSTTPCSQLQLLNIKIQCDAPVKLKKNATMKNYLEHQPCFLKLWIRACCKV